MYRLFYTYAPASIIEKLYHIRKAICNCREEIHAKKARQSGFLMILYLIRRMFLEKDDGENLSRQGEHSFSLSSHKDEEQ